MRGEGHSMGEGQKGTVRGGRRAQYKRSREGPILHSGGHSMGGQKGIVRGGRRAQYRGVEGQSTKGVRRAQYSIQEGTVQVLGCIPRSLVKSVTVLANPGQLASIM